MDFTFLGQDSSDSGALQPIGLEAVPEPVYGVAYGNV